MVGIATNCGLESGDWIPVWVRFPAPF